MATKHISRRMILKTGAAGVAAMALPMPFINSASAAEDIVLGAVYVGPRDDFGWNQAHAVAMEILKNVDNVTVIEEENVPELSLIHI